MTGIVWKNIVLLGSRRTVVGGKNRRGYLKAGTVLEGLNLKKGEEPVVSKERSEYPNWVSKLSEPPKTLAALRKIENLEAADDKEQMRYLKLTRRILIKENNEKASVQ